MPDSRFVPVLRPTGEVYAVVPELDYKLLAFDADGTLRRSTVPSQPCPNRRGEWELLPHVREHLASYAGPSADGMRFAVVSNQGGVALGHVGDQESDRECARHACVDFAHVEDAAFYGAPDLPPDPPPRSVDPARSGCVQAPLALRVGTRRRR